MSFKTFIIRQLGSTLENNKDEFYLNLPFHRNSNLIFILKKSEFNFIF